MVSVTQEGQGFLASLVSSNVLIACGIIGAIYLIDFLVAPRLDPREPPLLKPKIPLIGHIIGLFWHQFNYHTIVREQNPVPVASLQMLWGRIYTIWDPHLAQASLRSRNLSFEPFVLDFAEKAFGLDAIAYKKVMEDPKLVPEFTEAIHASMQPKHVHAMNVKALSYISRTLDAIAPGEDGGIEASNMFDWIKDLITSATTEALLGVHNPFSKDPSLYDDLWTMELGLTGILTKPFPSITARKAVLARNRMQRVLGDYYEAKYDHAPEAAELTRGRANTLRRFGFSGREIAQMEIMLPIVGTTNSSPIMYWMICNIFAKPDLIIKLREELLPLLQKENDDVITVNLERLESDCPLLVSCYRETLRLANFNVSSRRVLDDTTISDANGRSYLLKKGVDVQISGTVMHVDNSTWGPNAHRFDPGNFYISSDKPSVQSTEERTKRNAYIPFGGGKHLCPGRNFAFAEILAVSCALALGYEVNSIGMAFDEMKPAPAFLGSASYKPRRLGEGLGLRIRRREGWEKVKWRFVA